MAASWFLVLIDVVAIMVYLDLWIVNKFKVHIYTPLMKYIPKKKLKEY